MISPLTKNQHTVMREITQYIYSTYKNTDTPSIIDNVSIKIYSFYFSSILLQLLLQYIRQMINTLNKIDIDRVRGAF